MWLGGQKVYDVTEYMDDHPGGSEILLETVDDPLEADDRFQ